MKCENPKCNQDHDGSFGGGRFCSRACANSRVRTKESKAKTSQSMKVAIKEGRAKPPNGSNGDGALSWSKEKWKEVLEKRKKNWEQRLLEEDFDNLGEERARKRILLEQDDKCNRCGLDEWLGEPLILELEHKDGNGKNNRRENLECLCPNCHSLTSTWRGRNKKNNGDVKYRPRITNEERVKAFLEMGNIRQALIKLGLAPKGGNYGFMKKALTEWGIDYKGRID